MYIVWCDYHTDGWHRSEDIPDLEGVLAYITSDMCTSTFIVTETVDIKLERKDKHNIQLPGLYHPPGARMIKDIPQG